jgi:adenine-specific DNA glycosylase
MVMWHFPEVQTVKTSFIWLAHDQTTDAKYERRHLDALWRALQPRFDYVQETIDLGVFKTKPSPLCKWCPARSICPDSRK